MLFNNICGAVWIGRFNIVYILLKRFGHFECSDVYCGTYMCGLGIGRFKMVDWIGIFNNITCILLERIGPFECRNVYGGTYIIGWFFIIYVPPYELVEDTL